MKGSSEL